MNILLYVICIGILALEATILNDENKEVRGVMKLSLNLAPYIIPFRVEIFITFIIITLVSIIIALIGNFKYLDVIVKEDMEFKISIIIIILTLTTKIII